MPIHPSAIIDPSSEVSPDATVGPYAVVGPGCKIGPGCRIGSHAVVEFTTLGPNCEIYPHAAIGLAGQHLRYKGEPARVEVGSGTVFREFVTVHRGTPFDQSVTRVGNNCYLMATAHIAHDCRVGNNVTIANGSMLGGHAEVGDNVFISGLAAVHQFGRVGKGAIISGGAMANQDIAPFCIAQGDRALIRGLNVVGMRRLGMDRHQIREVKEAFRVVFLSGLRLEEALAAPEFNTGSDPINVFREFLKNSKRGFARTARDVTSAEAAEEAVG